MFSARDRITIVSLAGYSECRWRLKMGVPLVNHSITLTVDKRDSRFQAALVNNWSFRRLNKTATKLVHELRDMELITGFALHQNCLEVEVTSVHDWVEVEPFLIELLTRRYQLCQPVIHFNYHTLAC